MTDAVFVFHISFFKNHLLLLSGMLFISLCASSNAQQTGQECHEEQLGVWTGIIPFSSRMNVSIDNELRSWGNVLLNFQEKGTIKGKILLKKSGYNLKINGIGIDLTAVVPTDFLRYSKKLTLSFQMTNRAKQMTVWNGIESFTSAITGITSLNIDSIRIYSKRNLDNFSKTVFSVCNLDRTLETRRESGNQIMVPCMGVITCPPCPTVRTCPKSEPSLAPKESMCPPCLTKNHLATFPPTTSTATPCPSPVEKTCPPCPTTSCPYVSSPPAKIACPKKMPCPTPTPCTLITASDQEKQYEDNASRDLIRNYTFNLEGHMQKAIFLEDWDEWIMYGLAAGCTALLLVSVALTVALGKAKKKVNGHGTCQNLSPQQNLVTEWNHLNNLSGTLGTENVQEQMNFHHTGNLSQNAETDEDDFDSDLEEWYSKEAIFSNIDHRNDISSYV